DDHPEELVLPREREQPRGDAVERAAHEGDLPPSLGASADAHVGDEGEDGRGHRSQRKQRPQLRPAPALPADVSFGPGAGSVRRARDEEGEPARVRPTGAHRAGDEVPVDDDAGGCCEALTYRRARVGSAGHRRRLRVDRTCRRVVTIAGPQPRSWTDAGTPWASIAEDLVVQTPGGRAGVCGRSR